MESVQNNNKFLQSPKVLYIVFGVILFITLSLAIVYLKQAGILGNLKIPSFTKAETVSPYVLWLTTPVTTFSGKIDKVSGNTIWVTQTFTEQSIMPAAPIPVAPAISPGEAPKTSPVPTKTITLQAVVNDKTSITRAPVNVPYLLKTNPVAPMPQPTNLKLADLKAGQIVNVTSTTDLRKVTNDEFEATAIQTTSSNSISGRISRVESNKIYVKAIVPTTPTAAMPPMTAGQPASAPQEKEYTITVTSDTEISRPAMMAIQPNASPSPPHRYSLGDLKPDMQVMVYTDADTSLDFEFNALLVQPQIIETPPPPPTIPAPETSASPTP